MPFIYKNKRCNEDIIQYDNALKDLKALENIISGQKELDDLKKSYEDAISSTKSQESLLYKKMINKYKTS